jgi:hypothetical protein
MRELRQEDTGLTDTFIVHAEDSLEFTGFILYKRFT